MAEDNPIEETTEAIAKRSFPPDLPLLVSGEVVIYPYMAAPLLIDDETTIRTVEEAMNTGTKSLRCSVGWRVMMSRRSPSSTPRM